MEYNHFPVLYDDVINGLNINPNGIYVDGTLGGGGHTEGIVKQLTTGKLIANDLDQTSIEFVKEKLKTHLEKMIFLNDDYKNLCNNLKTLGIETIDGILIDMGVSSYQIDTAERGFSYIKNAKLDMRMNKNQTLTAYDVVNEYSLDELKKIFFEYGEERYSKEIAKTIINERKKKPIETTLELAEIITNSYPARERFKNGNPSKRVFQALRIEVNNELRGLFDFIYNIAMMLKKGGRMCVITFHSLEDRIVKQAFKELEKDCICDKKMPICTCNKRKEIEIITKKPILGSKESEINKRSESAKLRIIEKI